jgi:hypothetical protein
LQKQLVFLYLLWQLLKRLGWLFFNRVVDELFYYWGTGRFGLMVIGAALIMMSGLNFADAGIFV